MQTLQELGQAVAEQRKAMGIPQRAMARTVGITAEALCRFERGRGAEFGSRKLLAVLSVLGLELAVTKKGEGAGARPGDRA